MESHLVSKGKSEPLEGLVEQGRALVRLAQRYADELDAQGWSQDATAELDLGVAKLESEEARVVARRTAPFGAVPDPERSPPDEIDGAFARDLVRKAAPKIAGVLEKIRPAAAAIDERLATGKKATEALSAATRALEQVGAPTEVGGGFGRGLNATAVYAMKGKVLERMEALNEAAGRAFAGRRDVLSRFNLDLLEQARRAGRQR